MPKMKTRGAVKKRFKLTSSGKIKRHKAFHSHILTKKNAARKNDLTQPTLVSAADHKRIRRMMHG